MNLDKVYKNSPIFLQNLICSTYGYLEKLKRFNRNFFIDLKELNESQFASYNDINQFKASKLEALLSNAKTNVPYYRDLFKNISTLNKKNCAFEKLKLIPILDKETLRANEKGLVSLDFNIQKLQVVQTSGTTGKAIKLYREKKTTSMQWAIWFRHRGIYNCKFGDLHVNFTGKKVVPTDQIEPPYWRFNKPMNQFLINMQHITPEKITHIVKFLNTIKPKFYSGYPSIIAEVSRLALSQNLKLNEGSKPKVVFAGAENTLEYQKKAIEKWTDAVVTDQYGLTEANCNLTRCEHGYYHEDYEFGHIECLEPKTLPNGNIKGKLIGTSFCNNAMPLIRYDTGDVAIWKPSDFKCPCGRASQVIESIEGRVDDFVILEDGRRIMRFDYLFKSTDTIKEAQVCQYEIGEVVIKISTRDNYSTETESKIKNDFKHWICPTTKVKFEYVDQIEKSNTGKFKAVQSFL